MLSRTGTLLISPTFVCSTIDPGYEPHHCLLTGIWKSRYCCHSGFKKSAGAAREVNLRNKAAPLAFGLETSPEFQNRCMSGPSIIKKDVGFWIMVINICVLVFDG